LGVWIVEFILLAFVLLYFTLSMIRHFSFWPGSISGVILSIFLRSPKILQGGNSTEVYAVGFILIFITYIINNKDKNVNWIFPGFLAVIIFLTKQSLIAVPIIVFLWLLWDLFLKRKKKQLLSIIYFLAGIILTGLIVVVLLMIFGILRDFWDSNFIYMRCYIVTNALPKLELIRRLIKGIFYHHFENIIVFILITGVILFNYRHFNNDRLKFLSFIALFGLPMELVFITIPGNFFGHYFYSLVPYITVGILLFMVLLFSRLFVIIKKKYLKVLIVIFFLFLTNSYYPIQNILQEYNRLINVAPKNFLEAKEEKNSEKLTANYFKSIPKKYDLFIWGAEPQYYFFSKREAPSKYIFVYHLIDKNYFTKERFDEFFTEIKSDPPEIIINASYMYQVFNREYYDSHPEDVLSPFYEFVGDKYIFVDVIDSTFDEWHVYILAEKSAELEDIFLLK
jgi:hypothetical protein